jgi:hypothetical protein
MMITVRGSCGVVHSSFEEWQSCKACRAAEFKNEQMSRAFEQLTGDRYEFKGALRRARQMWSGPFPELFTPDGQVRRHRNAKVLRAIMWLLGLNVLLALVALARPLWLGH